MPLPMGKIPLAMLIVLLCIGTPTQAQQQPTVEDYYQLQRRVVEQEQRLQALESNQNAATNPVVPISNVHVDGGVEGRLSEVEEIIHELRGVQENTVDTQMADAM